MSDVAPSDALAIAQALLRCPSVTPDEGGAQQLLEQLLAPAGFIVTRVRFEEPGTVPIDNLYARLGERSPLLVFAGHTDVVPPGPADTWRHGAFAAQIDDGMLYGRGAQDMKGGIAAFAAACLAFVAERGNAFDGSIGLLITGDEEGPAVNGTSKLLDWAQARGEHFDACIVGEPTSRSRVGDTLKVGRRGSLNGRLIVTGRQGHVAYPEKADNPIPTLLRILAAFLEPLDEATPSFDPSNLEVTSVDVDNAATNVVPGAATAAFNIRFNDRWTADTLAAEVGRRMERAAAGKDARLEWLPSNAPAFRTTESPFTELLASAIEAETGRRPECSTSGGTSDARFIQRFCPVVELGLVGDTMHMVDERVPVADLEMLAAIYRRVLETFFA